jgi:Fur family ferric uptake transcriptional regulator
MRIQQHHNAHPPSRQRFTRQGAAIDALLLECADSFQTAQSLHDQLRKQDQAVGLATVYRHLRRLANNRAVEVVIQSDGEAAYRLCGPATADAPPSHHHHLVCRLCGHTVEIDGPEVEVWARRVARQAGFTNVTHTVEIFGECDRHR